MAQTLFIKDPDSRLDFKFDFAANTNGDTDATDWLASGETISAYVIDAEAGITVDTDALSDANTSVTVWLSGGTVGAAYRVACHITTTVARQDERTFRVRIRER